MPNFTWIPFYKELAHKLMLYRNKQTELIDFLENLKSEGMPSIPTNDIDSQGNNIKLNAIDFFTFFASFNRGITDKYRVSILKKVKTKFDIAAEVPSDFNGIPVVNNLHSWFFAYEKDRTTEDIPMLWNIAELAISDPDTITEELFNGCLKIRGVAAPYLSIGLYWINPERFAACDGVITGYLKKKGFSYTNVASFSDYLTYIRNLKNFIPEKSYPELSFEAWVDSKKTKGVAEPASSTKYWLFAPGTQAEMWEEFKSLSIIGIEADALGDLKGYKNKPAIAKRLQELANVKNPGSKKNDATACDDFANKMSVGDVIIIKTKQKSLLGYGIVVSDYYFDDERRKYKSCRKVKWEKTGNWTTEFQLVQKTLTDISEYSSNHPDYNFYFERLMAIINGLSATEMPKSKKTAYSLNQILFGPPGTGKTYNSINHALAIVENKELEAIEKESNENRPEIVKRFQTYVDSGQVVFTTFHQSMSYEDFIEGIKPIEAEGQLLYDVQRGVFRLLVDDALTNFKNSKLQTGKKLFETVWVKFLSPLNEEETIPVKMKQSTYQIVHVNDRTIFFDKNSGDSKHTLSVNTLKSMYDAGENQIIKGGLQPYYEALLGNLLGLGKESTKVEPKNYVLIIDEINRGNVAQIFGELITLIETDKRFGNKESITVTLPYSKKKDFSIPPNLYIVGTMNTADRSVEALDTALRRRFTFIEMPPKYDLPELENEVIDGITLERIMRTVNARIEKLLDKDHLIGHSYFLSVDDLACLKKVFHQNILPLLQEYFYGDFAKIGLILGEAFFDKVEGSGKNIFAKFAHDAIDELNEKPVYRIKQVWNDGEFERAIQEMVSP